MQIYDDNPFMAHPPGKKLWQVVLNFQGALKAGQIEQCSEVLEPLALSIMARNQNASDGDDWLIEMVCVTPPSAQSLEEALVPAIGFMPHIHLEELQDRDWLSHVHDAFPPFTVGDFFVYGSHYTGPRPNDKIPLQIDAATAFGSGEHGTTAGCLQALSALKRQQQAFALGLDMGCGSGILGVAMVKLWPEMAVTAVDIDPESVRVTQHHAELNDVSLSTLAGNGYQALDKRLEGSFDLIVANILANPLIEMASDLHRFLKPGGKAVLSGLLVRQKESVLQAHLDLGLKLESEIAQDEWQTLVLIK